MPLNSCRGRGRGRVRWAYSLLGPDEFCKPLTAQTAPFFFFNHTPHPLRPPKAQLALGSFYVLELSQEGSFLDAPVPHRGGEETSQGGIVRAPKAKLDGITGWQK